jgi:hypothetical protein
VRSAPKSELGKVSLVSLTSEVDYDTLLVSKVVDHVATPNTHTRQSSEPTKGRAHHKVFLARIFHHSDFYVSIYTNSGSLLATVEPTDNQVREGPRGKGLLI